MASTTDVTTLYHTYITEDDFSFTHPESTFLNTSTSVHGFSEIGTATLVAVIFGVSIFGLLGNSIVFLIALCFSDMHTLINFSFANLALTDMFLLVFDAVPTGFSYVGLEYISGTMACQVLQYLRYVAAQVTSLTLAYLAWDRYCLIVRPVESYSSRSAKHNILIMIFIWIVSFVVHIWAALASTYAESADLDFKEYGLSWGQDAFFTFTTITNYVVPVLVILPCYTSIAVVLMKKSSHATDAAKSHRYKMGTVRIIVVGLFYAVMWFPIRVVHLWVAYDPNVMTDDFKYQKYHTMANVLLYINSSVNPYLYAFGGTSNPFIGHLKDIGQHCFGGIMKLRGEKNRDGNVKESIEMNQLNNA